MKYLLILLLPFALMACTNTEDKTASNPNIVIIYVDDLGYADVGCYGAIGVETPNIDKMASAGLRFTDAHCSAATCTPSRFSLLTGSYAFRNNAAVLPGDAPLLIRPGTATLASMLKKAGYKTGIVGKWHLGLGNGDVDWNSDVMPGPLEIGFDYCFLLPATGDRVPCVFVENHRVVGLDPADPITVSYAEPILDLPTGLSNPELLKVGADTQHSQTIINGISRIGTMSGGESAWWVDEEFPDIFTGKAINFIEENRENPFFLFFSFHDIHVPRIVNPRFEGKSKMGARGDAIAQMDWCTGEIIKTLEDNGLAENTLVIFTSDNGPVLDDGYHDQAVELIGEHNPSGPFRGGKYSAYEAGTRVPTIVYWPSTVEHGVSDALMTQVDLFASLASFVGTELEPDDAPDSFDHMPAWLGETEDGRKIMLEEAFTLALRDGNWKYIRPYPEDQSPPTWFANKGVESGLTHEEQLYNLEDDPGEQKNIAGENPQLLTEMKTMLKEIVDKENSRE
ncbi:arylsulfatase [Bacteroidota bacterium]